MSDPDAPDDDLDDFSSVDPVDTLRMMIASAIHLGAPVYNAGDIRGCYEIYAATARLLTRVLEGVEDSIAVLVSALQEASLEVDVDEQAWIMRRAFDQLLGEESEGESDEPNE